LPTLGLTPAFIATLSLSGHSNPAAQAPQASIVFGVLYFAVLALAKALLLGGAAVEEGKGAGPRPAPG